MKRALIYLLIAIQVIRGEALAATCTFVSSTCTDTTPSKTIAGTVVPVEQIGGCWNYQDTYECDTAGGTNYCQPLIDLSCGVLSSVCASTSPISGECMSSTDKYMCTDVTPGDPLPNNIALLSTEYRITGDTIDESSCTAMASSGTCLQTGTDVCTDPGPTKNINGLDVTRDCWTWERTFLCKTGATASSCGPLQANKDCSEVSSACLEEKPAAEGGGCALLQHEYKCTTGGSSQTVTSSCDSQQYCEGAACYDMGYEPNTAFGESVATKEVLRQIGYYLTFEGGTIFNGHAERCDTKGFSGLGHCCKPESGGNKMSNQSVSQQFQSAAIKSAAQTVYYIGSTYVYDMMWNSGVVILENMAESAFIESGWSGSVNFYGFTWNIAADGSISYGGFSWAGFWVAIIIMIIMAYAECDDEDQRTQLAKGQNLCVHVDDDCLVRNEWGACFTLREFYCCYNSVLAKIIAQQGGAQLGRPPARNRCDGFTPEQLQQMDFSRMDFSEFINTIQLPTKVDSSGVVSTTKDETGPAQDADALVKNYLSNQTQQ